MVKTKVQKISMFALAGVLSVGMLAGSTGLQKVQAAPDADEASIIVGKTLTTNGTRFPNIQNFNFQLAPVEGYTNPNISTSVDGQSIAAAAVPTPGGTTGQTVTKAVGDFTASESGDTASVKIRKDAFDDIQYTTAGYYMYRLTEVIPNPQVSGVVYDESSYYVIVYVVNNVDNNGNTADGVHVESITAWHNAAGTSAANELKPNLKDIAANGYQNGDNNTGDNAGADPADNDTYGNTGDQRYDDLGKVGVSDSNSKNVLDATQFWNRQEMHDIDLTKNVKGNLGDKTKQFEFTVTMTGLEAGQTYAVTKTGAAQLVSATVGSVDNSASTFTADASGNATFLVKLADDQGVKFVDIPNGVTYAVSEAASNHAPSYEITSSNNAAPYTYTAVSGEDAKAAPTETYYTSNDGSDVAVSDVNELNDSDTVYTKAANNAAPIIAKDADDTDDAKETALATATETVNPSDANITIAYTNQRDLETITGIPSMAIYFGMAGLMALLAFFGIRRRKDDGIVEM